MMIDGAVQALAGARGGVEQGDDVLAALVRVADDLDAGAGGGGLGGVAAARDQAADQHAHLVDEADGALLAAGARAGALDEGLVGDAEVEADAQVLDVAGLVGDGGDVHDLGGLAALGVAAGAADHDLAQGGAGQEVGLVGQDLEGEAGARDVEDLAAQALAGREGQGDRDEHLVGGRGAAGCAAELEDREGGWGPRGWPGRGRGGAPGCARGR
jgi:hypothetical protein